MEIYVRIMCQSWVTCLHVDCCFSELSTIKFNSVSQCVGLIQSRHHHHLLKKVDSSFNDITENKISHLALNRNCLLAQPTIYHGAQFYWWRNPEISGQNHWAATSHYHIILYLVHLATGGNQAHNFVIDRHCLCR